VEVFGSGVVNDSQHLAEIRTFNLQAFSFKVPTLEESAGMLLDEADGTPVQMSN
jgi:hypothetical protein